ncbi:urea ABC transporter substrate-binding protein [Thioalbus denitrificans]|uniref:Amino acid/amide ABC transporter substrate-binding protein (HAAT family) n=1 Tax=Thioalbus denitrificans TaxID=547122 RepID=A0A369CC00_9GAMM|nr:urea ABC transporter substrate-binding protein [Thioalbus denitrificans]RCX31223.1 amino acid/amide ABC transporter substrate-binding protein (HAAT family) [Thioalbus denitrificans]
MHTPTRRFLSRIAKTGLAAAMALSLAQGAQAAPATAAVNTTGLAVDDASVTVGILHSLSGTIAITESSVVDAEKLAIDEINAAGGVLGRQIKVVVEDGASDWPTFAEKANKLLGSDKAAAVFGCYTSASRKAVLPVFERGKGLLYYPTYYEGLEQSPNIIYTGQEATQQNIAAVEWLIKEKGAKTFYLLGSDYIWPRTTNKIAKKVIERLGGKVVAEEYAPLGHTQFGSIINKIKLRKPDVVLSTIVGGSNVALYKQLKAAGLDGGNKTLMAFAITEEEVRGIGAENVTGVYVPMGYFQTVDNEANRKFVAAFKARYGEDRVIGDTMEAGYIAPYLWKAAVEKAGSFDVEKVAAASAGLELDAPEGMVKLHDSNHHLYKYTRIGQIRADGLMDIVHETGLIEPNPYPEL